ncbi:glycoside hydrolase family 5 protein [Echinicola soli]|uniref:Glycoside hydrolase family 5 protein n=1 Tax=Echinicola soli TaxID=2591634 RepID=A0A514CH84_9BACT|nr:cellulase family glycosylhydrolase [Echinicola soli]QDH79168.1 glycoside hydrolase family 5 protein [Echinicola soli]
MTKLSNLLFLLLSICGILLFPGCTSGNNSHNTTSHLPDSSMSKLSADKTKVVNEQGEEVILRAIGLGGWLLQEGYMLNPKGSKIGTQWQMKKALYDQGLSMEEVEAFYQEWRDKFITKKDIDNIASLGFNAIRIPMHYELFLTSTQRSMRNKAIIDTTQLNNYINGLSKWLDEGSLFAHPGELEGIQILDKLLGWCEANGMYVILDLHAAPGGQGTDANIADILVKNDLWNRKDEQGRHIYQEVTVELWKMLSGKYIDDNRIAWYDLINEPNNVPSNGPIHALFDRLITTIREMEDSHLIMVEGNGWGNNYDLMEPSTFAHPENLIYNAHRYWIPAEEDTILDPNPNQINRIVNLTAFRDRHQVPVWVGETGENNNAWLKQNIEKMEEANIGWCHWTYKRFDKNENAALRRIQPPYLTEGISVMQKVLKNIQFSNTIPNTKTIQTVAPTP